MPPTHIQDILPLVEAPSRYLGNEVNAVVKDERKVDLKLALAFPDLYEIGTSHFGMQILYHILNQRPDILAERVFAPAPDMQGYLRDRNLPLQSLESGRPLDRFDVIGFSLLYELNYTNLLGMLELSGLPPKSKERSRRHPLIIAGGPCTCNPEPVADFFDAIVVGEGEQVVLELADAWIAWHRRGGASRRELLRNWSHIRGVYIPSFFDVRYKGDQIEAIHPHYDDHQGVERVVLADLDGAEFPTSPIVPYGRPVHDRLRLELARGCTRGCRFCQAGMIYRPVRERSPQTVLEQCAQSLQATGYDDISLLSLSTGDYGAIAPLMGQLIRRYACDHVALSLPSLRAGTLTPELMEYIRSVRKTGFTIAPEAGSQRLRDLINKNITVGDIQQTVRDAFALGWNVVKLYFMIGLPTERKEDLEALVELVRDLTRIKIPGGRNGTINVSVATLIPKPHTPFQWAPQIPVAEAWAKIDWLRQKLRSPRVQFKWQNPEVSYIEGLMARGDRRMGELILGAYRKGCRFDGWSDHFRFDLWQEAIREQGIDADAYVHRERSPDEVFPWQHIDMKVQRAFLWEEWQCALRGEATQDCRDGACQDCGVCDFVQIKPRIHSVAQLTASSKVPESASPQRFRKLQIAFSKTDAGRFWGHLEMVNIFERALRRAGIALQFSQGFHPKPKMTFTDALPIGLESLCETLLIGVPEDLDADDLVARLNRRLPRGLAVNACSAYRKPDPRIAWRVVYRVDLERGQFHRNALQRFETAPNFIHERINRKGKLKKIDLKAMVDIMRRTSPQSLEITFRQRQDAHLRPDTILREVFQLNEAQIRQARTIKLRYEPYQDQPSA